MPRYFVILKKSQGNYFADFEFNNYSYSLFIFRCQGKLHDFENGRKVTSKVLNLKITPTHFKIQRFDALFRISKIERKLFAHLELINYPNEEETSMISKKKNHFFVKSSNSRTLRIQNIPKR